MGGIKAFSRRTTMRVAAVLSTLSLLAVGVALAPPASAAPGSLTLSKSSSVGTLQPGEQLAYTLLAGCSGLTEGCINATITDVLPAELEVTSIPQSTVERTVTYDPATRKLTVVFQIALNNPSGFSGLPAGLSRSIAVGMRLPTETPVQQGQQITNNATFTGIDSVGAPLTPANASATVTADVPVEVRPVATKAWAPAAAIAQSGDASVISLGVRNASSTSADVRRLTVSDGNASGSSRDTFERFDVTSLGPIVSYPPGADRVVIGVCTLTAVNACTGGAPDTTFTGELSGNGPFTPPTGVALADITYVSFTFVNSLGATIPYSGTQGVAHVGVRLRDTVRSTGLPLQPQTPLKTTNLALPSALDAGEVITTGVAASAIFTIQPDTVSVVATKSLYADNAGTWTKNGDIVVGQDSGVSMRVGVTNASAGPVRTLTIVEPSPSAPTSEFAKIDADQARFTWPAGATGATLAVVCRSGASPAHKAFVNSNPAATIAIASFGCAAGVAPASITLSYTGVNVGGEGTIAAGANSYLDIHGTAPRVDASDVSNGLTNCAQASAATPTASSAVSIACSTATVHNPTPGLGSLTKSSSGVQTIVAGQPLDFTVGFKNTGNVPATNAYVVDPPDPTASPNPFDTVRLTHITVPASPASVTEVWDSRVSAYVPYVASNTALLLNAKGFRVRITGPVPVGATFTVRYSVLLRDGVEPPATFTNCAQFGLNGQDYGTPRCSPTITVVDGSSTSASLNKLLSVYDLTRPEPGLPAQKTTVKHVLRNDGPLYLKRLQLIDAEPAFFDAVTFANNMRANMPPGANRVQVDVCTTGCQSNPVVWVNGTATSSTTPGLPAGIVAADVQGVRVTFSNSGGGYALLPTSNLPTTGACPNATFCFDVVVRETLRSAPSTPVPDTITDVSSGAGESRLQTPGTTFPIPPVSADLTLHDGNPVMRFTKGPDSRIASGDLAPFDLTIENTGTTAIVDPVIIDPLPDALTLEDNAPGGSPGRPFTITYSSMPAGYPTQDPAAVTYTPTVVSNRTTQVKWAFTGWALPPGGRVDVRIYVTLTPGTLAGDVITNTAGASGSNSGFACDPVNTTSTTSPLGPALFCTDTATVEALSGNNVNASKWSSGDPALGLYLATTGELVSATDVRCPHYEVAGIDYTRYPCAALVPAGGDLKFLVRLVNAGTDPIDHAVIVDGLPVPGDTGVLLKDHPRDTTWSQQPTMLTPVTVEEGYAGITTGYTDQAFPGFCTDNLNPGAPLSACAGTFDAAFGATNTGFRTEMQFPSNARLQPGQGVTLTWTMQSPLTLDAASESPAAWNSFAQKSTFWNSGSGLTELPATEPPKAGAVMRFNTVDVTKDVVGEVPLGAATSYDMQYSCLVAGAEISSGAFTIDAFQTFTLPFQPVGATCFVWEDTVNGGSSPNQGSGNAAVIVVPDPSTTETAPTVTITNTFESGRLTLTKSVSGAITPGPSGGGTLAAQHFPVTVDCVYPGGDTVESLPGFPMQITITPGSPVVIDEDHGTPVPANALCTVTETDLLGATSVTMTSNSGVTTTDGTIDVIVEPVSTGGATIDVANTYAIAHLTVIKRVAGAPPAGRSWPFTVACRLPGVGALAPVSFSLKANQSHLLSVPSGVTCVVRETNKYGAVTTYTDTSGAQDGVVTVSTSRPASVTVLNSYWKPCTITTSSRSTSSAVPASGLTTLVWRASTPSACGIVVPGGGQVIASRVRCYQPTTRVVPFGDATYCSAYISRSGRVVVRTYGDHHVVIEVTLVAKPRSGVKGYRSTAWVRRWTVA